MPIPSTPPHILVVYDDDAVRETIMANLEMAGYAVSAAPKAEEALLALQLPLSREQPVDLLVVDFDMPVMSGPELIREARRRGFRMPTLLISGWLSGPAVGGLSALKGADRMLAKPFSPDDLLHAVRAVLDGGVPSSVEKE